MNQVVVKKSAIEETSVLTSVSIKTRIIPSQTFGNFHKTHKNKEHKEKEKSKKTIKSIICIFMQLTNHRENN